MTQAQVSTALGQDLQALLASASTPDERMRGRWVTSDGRDAVARFERWSRLVADDRPERIERVLAARGLTRQVWARAWGAADLVDPTAAPQWAQNASWLLDRCARGEGSDRLGVLTVGEVAGEGLPGWVDAAAPWRFHPGFRVWLEDAHTAVDQWCGLSGAPVGPAARRELVLHLGRRLLAACGPTLMAAAEARPDDGLFGARPVDDWLSLWDRYPVMARLIAQIHQHWRSATRELLSRLAADLPTLAPRRRVAGLGLEAGDQHAGGRAMTVVRLDDGAVLYLKPRSDRLHRPLRALLAAVEEAGEPFGLRLPEIIDRPGYSWVREVSRGQCAGPAEVDEYYYRAGALLRVLQCIGATDLHHENFVATADQAVLIDLETVFPVAGWRDRPDDQDPALARALVDTPAATSMVTSAVDGPPGRSSLDLGALAGPSTGPTPYEVQSLVLTAAGPRLVGSRQPLSNGTALPVLGGRAVGLRGHEDALWRGFHECQRRLAGLPDAGAAASAGTEAAVRFVARPTRTYARLLAASLTAPLLTDGAERELVLERLWRGLDPAPPGLVAAEQRALRQLDIPMFSVPFDGTDVLDERGQRTGAAVATTPRADACRRLRDAAGRRGLAETLRATVFCADPHPGPVVEPATRVAEPAGVAPFVAAAHVLLGSAIELDDETVTWVGLDHDPARNRWRWGRLGAGLTGDAGIGLVLAALAASELPLDDEARARMAVVARAALLGSVSRAAAPPSPWEGAEAFTGPSGTMYAAARAAALLADEQLLDAAGGLIPAVSAAARVGGRGQRLDSVAGAALALLHLPRDHRRTILALEEVAGLVPDDIVGEGDAIDSWTGSLPSARQGRRLAADRLARRGLGPPPRGEVPATDLTSGDLVVAAALGDEPPAGGDRAATRPTAGTWWQHLDAVEIGRAGLIGAPGNPWCAGLRSTDSLVALHHRHGRWFAGSQAHPAMLLSALHGTAAIAMLALSDRHDAPHLRLFT